MYADLATHFALSSARPRARDLPRTIEAIRSARSRRARSPKEPADPRGSLPSASVRRLLAVFRETESVAVAFQPRRRIDVGATPEPFWYAFVFPVGERTERYSERGSIRTCCCLSAHYRILVASTYEASRDAALVTSSIERLALQPPSGRPRAGGGRARGGTCRHRRLIHFPVISRDIPRGIFLDRAALHPL